MISVAERDAPSRCTPVTVAVHRLPGQARPMLVTTVRPLSVVACEALAAADRMLARDGARMAVLDGGASLQTSPPR